MVALYAPILCDTFWDKHLSEKNRFTKGQWCMIFWESIYFILYLEVPNMYKTWLTDTIYSIQSFLFLKMKNHFQFHHICSIPLQDSVAKALW